MTTGDELIGPFAEAVAIALREMAGAEAVIRNAAPATGTDQFGDVSVVLRLSTGGEGYMVLSLPTTTATALAKRILDGVAGELDDTMIRDCAGELANVIAGQAKTMLVGTPHHFTFATPTVTAGNPGLPAGERWVAAFVSEWGEFTLHLCLP